MEPARKRKPTKAARLKLTPEQQERRHKAYLEEKRAKIPEMEALGLHPDEDGNLISGSGEWPVWSRYIDMKRTIKARSYIDYIEADKRLQERQTYERKHPPPPPKESRPGIRHWDELEYNKKGRIQFNKIDCMILGSRLVHYQEYVDNLRHRYYDHGPDNFWNYIFSMGHESHSPEVEPTYYGVDSFAFNLMIMREALQAAKECNGGSINVPKMQRKPWGGYVKNPWGNIDEALKSVYEIEEQLHRFKDAFRDTITQEQVAEIIVPALNTISFSLDSVVGDGSKDKEQG